MSAARLPMPGRKALGALAAEGGAVRLPASPVQRWYLRSLVGIALAVLCMAYFIGTWSAKERLSMLAAGVLVVGLQAFMEKRFMHDRRRGFVLAIDAEGMRFRDLPLVPWSSIRDAELRLLSRDWHLVLALDPANFERMRDAASPDRIVFFWCHEADKYSVFLPLQDIKGTWWQIGEIVDAALRRHRGTTLKGLA